MAKTSKNVVDVYLRYLKLERNYSPNTIFAYRHDISHLIHFCTEQEKNPLELTLTDLQLFSQSLDRYGIAPKSHARILSGIRSFYRFLALDGYIDSDPSELLPLPQLGRHLPEVLTVEEVDAIIRSIDVSRPEGHRNRAIVEVLFSCGLRVTELVNLRLSNIHAREHVVQVLGKGNKERLVPISDSALHLLELWYAVRCHIAIRPSEEDYVFLNRRGSHLTRTMILIMLKRQAREAGITKTVSPHTLRHSFATEMLRRGADIRFIQAMLGHEDIATTEIYTHIDSTLLREEILLHHPRNSHPA